MGSTLGGSRNKQVAQTCNMGTNSALGQGSNEKRETLHPVGQS